MLQLFVFESVCGERSNRRWSNLPRHQQRGKNFSDLITLLLNIITMRFDKHEKRRKAHT